MTMEKEKIRAAIRKSYASIAARGAAGCGCGCGCEGGEGNQPMNAVQLSQNLGYALDELEKTPQNSNMGLGCGNPVAIASLKEGDHVLDLGSGGGLDCFVARSRVGETGHVIGVDMTPEMVALARKNAEESSFTNLEFRLGEIENLPVANQTIDVIISNCVVNLSLDKQSVFNEAYRVLKPGGRLCISDIVATAELPEAVKRDLTMIAGCIGGAEYVGNIEAMLQNAGFSKIKMNPKDNSKALLNTWSPGKKLEDYVSSFLIEAEK